jgi:hypothetical protein
LFRITLFERNKIEDFQRQHPTYRWLLGKRMGVDHRHHSGRISGILEWRINRAYGLIESVDPEHCGEILEALALYHKRNPATLALGYTPYGLLGKAKVKKKMVYGSPQADKEPRK